MDQLLARAGRVLMKAGQVLESAMLQAKGRDVQSCHHCRPRSWSFWTCGKKMILLNGIPE